jgi:hypothetical protein
MRAAIPTELLLRLMNATPEQYATVERVLGVSGENGRSRIEDGEPLLIADAARNLFRRAGSHWDVRFAGGTAFHLEDTVGTRYLDYLLQHRGEVISAFDLEVAIAPEKAQARARDSIQAQLDPETIRSYLRELTRLREEREIAVGVGDVAGADQLDTDIEVVEGALQAKGRDTGDAGERARNNVRKAVGAVLGRLSRGGKAEREFAAHLAECVRLGFEVMYQPTNREVWE